MILSYFKIQKGFIVYPFPCNLLHEIFFFWATTELLCKKGVHYFQPTGIIMQPYNTTAVLCLVWIGNISRQVFFCFVLLRHSTHPWFPLNILLRSSSERISTTMLVEFAPFFVCVHFQNFTQGNIQAPHEPFLPTDHIIVILFWLAPSEAPVRLNGFGPSRVPSRESASGTLWRYSRTAAAGLGAYKAIKTGRIPTWTTRYDLGLCFPHWPHPVGGSRSAVRVRAEQGDKLGTKP